MRTLRYFVALIPLGLVGCASMAGTTAHKGHATPPDSTAQLAAARVIERQGDIAQAQSMYQAVLKKDPNNSAANHRLGVLAARQGRFEQAYALFEKAYDQSNDIEVLADFGYALYLENRLDEAAEVMHHILSENPGHERTRINLGLVLGKQGNYDGAFAAFRSVVDEAKANSNMGYVYAQASNSEQAIRHFSRALDQNRDLKTASQGLLQLAEAQSRELENHNAGSVLPASSWQTHTPPDNQPKELIDQE